MNINLAPGMNEIIIREGAEETLETLRDTAIDKELETIKEIAPEIAIIEI